MTDTANSQPTGWLTEEEARRHVGGELGDVYRRVLSTSCAPICWFPRRGRPDLEAMHSGTVTIVQTPRRLMGITAAHVITELQSDQAVEPQTILLMNARLDALNVIDMNKHLDLATFEIDAASVAQIGKGIAPLTVWPPQAPTEGRGMLLAGYPRISRVTQTVTQNIGRLEWGLFTVIGLAGRVSDDQISWMVERERNVPHPTIPDPPPNAELGGISGGPVIGLFERRGIHYWGLSGIVSEASAQLERVVSKRADFIRDDGRIDRAIV
jgi:hypothetical protein